MTLTLTERDRTRLHADKYLLLLAAAQIVKCAERLAHDELPTFDDSAELTLLRNLEEHWEDPDGRSATELRATIPDITPDRIGFDGKRVWIERISLGDLVDWVTITEMRVRDVTSRHGPDLPPRADQQWLDDLPPHNQLHWMSRLMELADEREE